MQFGIFNDMQQRQREVSSHQILSKAFENELGQPLSEVNNPAGAAAA
ncbi:MAG: hypothetical protein OEU46_01605 [Alphaproteobacteria bacterium]|nr:hypothetical protein [Alphaproteobacteria bacterium]